MISPKKNIQKRSSRSPKTIKNNKTLGISPLGRFLKSGGSRGSLKSNAKSSTTRLKSKREKESSPKKDTYIYRRASTRNTTRSKLTSPKRASIRTLNSDLRTNKTKRISIRRLASGNGSRIDSYISQKMSKTQTQLGPSPNI